MTELLSILRNVIAEVADEDGLGLNEVMHVVDALWQETAEMLIECGLQELQQNDE